MLPNYQFSCGLSHKISVLIVMLSLKLLNCYAARGYHRTKTLKLKTQECVSVGNRSTVSDHLSLVPNNIVLVH